MQQLRLQLVSQDALEYIIIEIDSALVYHLVWSEEPHREQPCHEWKSGEAEPFVSRLVHEAPWLAVAAGSFDPEIIRISFVR